MSFKRIFFPFILIVLSFSLLSFVVNDSLFPLGQLHFTRLFKDLIYSNPELELEPNSITLYEDSTIITGNIDAGVIDNIVIIDRSVENDKRMILADKGEFSAKEEYSGVISLTLNGIFSHVPETIEKGNFSYTTAEKMIYNILLKDISPALRNPGPGQMSLRDVYPVIKEKQSALNIRTEAHKNLIALLRYKLLSSYQEVTDHLRDDNFQIRREVLEKNKEELLRKSQEKVRDELLKIWKLEFYQKLSIPFSCLSFVLLAFPLGLLAKKNGGAVGFGIGLLITAFYWVMLIGGKTIGIRTNISPSIIMWAPNVFISLVALPLIIRRAKQ